MRAIALVDLDDTLFQSLRRCPPDVPPEALVALGFASDGRAVGYATPRQAAFLSWLAETCLLIPVTARSRDALGRVRIRFGAAICAHGGTILDEAGLPDAGWAARIGREAQPHQQALADLADASGKAAAELGAALRMRIVAEDGAGLFVLLKHGERDEAALGAVLDRVEPLVPPGWTVHRNGNNGALIPPFLGKAKAVAALLPRLRALHPDAPVIGIGDSLTDAPFMTLCDYAMMPGRSQLSAATLERLA